MPGTMVAKKQDNTDSPDAHAYNIISIDGGIKIPRTPDDATKAPISPSG